MNDEYTEMLTNDLVASGFQVSEGYPMLDRLNACIDYTYSLLGGSSGKGEDRFGGVFLSKRCPFTTGGSSAFFSSLTKGKGEILC